MSEEKRFASGSGRDRDDALDQMLAGMAGEVPPVPEEFRRAWRQAVRQEAAAEARRSAGPSSGYPSGTAAAQPIFFCTERAPDRRRSLCRWRSE